MYNVYLGEHLIIENCAKEDLQHKLIFVQEYFDWYKNDDLRHEKIKIVPINNHA